MWITLKDFPKYEINESGQVRNKASDNILKGGLHTKGYPQVCLMQEGNPRNIQKTRKVHVLVAQTFLENPEGLPMVNHIDEDKTNPHVDNLEWCTAKYNADYSAKCFSITDPDGNVHHVKNETQFCKDNNLTRANIHKVLKGERPHHKGWTK